MLVRNVLAPERVAIAGNSTGDVTDKSSALWRLAQLLCCGRTDLDPNRVMAALSEREQLASTAIGGGVAVPHAALAGLCRQVGALLLCPEPIEFDAIDGEPVSIVFGLVGPRGAPTDHLKVLAGVSRLVRHERFRDRLVRARDAAAAYELVAATERGET